jgi:AcrR family transcriptional regulator
MNMSEAVVPRKRSSAERILSTAHDLFYRDGIRATGIDRIITESGVAKRTFYRQFPAKNDLILAFLEYRHVQWMSWFEAALQRHGSNLQAVEPALAEWFKSNAYRGCAFINAVAEIGPTMPAVVEISRIHKRDMVAAIRKLLPASSQTASEDAHALSLAVDGAIIRAQFDESPDEALASLAHIVSAIGGPLEDFQ